MAQNYKKSCIYARDEFYKLCFFTKKLPRVWYSREKSYLFGQYVVCYLQILIDILDKWYASFHMRSVVVKIECFFLFVGHLCF